MRIGLVISVDCEHRDRIDRLEPAPAICSVAQVGRIIVHRDATKEDQIFLLYNTSVSILCIHILSRPLLRLLYGDIGFVYPACL